MTAAVPDGADVLARAEEGARREAGAATALADSLAILGTARRRRRR